MSTTANPAQLAKTLPGQLLRFFKKYPPPALFPELAAKSSITPTSTTAQPTTAQDGSIISSTPPVDPNTPAAELSSPQPIPTSAPRASNIPAHAYDLPYPNPFLPSKNFATGRWRGAAYGLRRQADLVKLATQHGVVDLLPWTIKKPGERDARRIERGLQVKGTGEGQRVKGHGWERTMKGRLEARRKAMEDMPRLIAEWKLKGHGRGWKKWPSARAK